MPKTLVVLEGDFAGEFVRAHLGRDTTVYGCQDSFTYGPLVDLSVGALLQKRYRYWRETVYKHRKLDWSRPDRTLTLMMAEADRIEIWLGASTNEQLLLLVLNTWIRQEGIDLSRVSVRQYHLQDGFPLAYAKVSSLPEPEHLTAKHSDWLAKKWQAITAPSPERLFASSEDGTSALMQSALCDMVSFFPDSATGLGAVEHRLLSSVCEAWTSAIPVVGDAMAAGKPLLGDLVLFWRLVTLAQGPHPAIELRGKSMNVRSCEVRLTETGAACLAGTANLVEVNGLNTWVGGVHLNSEIGSVWYRPSSA